MSVSYTHLDVYKRQTEDEAKVYLTQIAETVPSLSHVNTYIKIIGEKYRIRQLMQAAKTILEQSAEEPDADLLLESAEQKIYEIRSGRDSNALTPISSVIIDTYAHLQEISGPNKEDVYKRQVCEWRMHES